MKFQFLDRERELKYTFRDVLRLREKYDGKEFSIKEIPELIATGLKRDDPTMTPSYAAEIVDMEKFDALCDAVRQASGLSRPDETQRPTAERSESAGPSHDMISGSPIQTSGN